MVQTMEARCETYLKNSSKETLMTRTISLSQLLASKIKILVLKQDNKTKNKKAGTIFSKERQKLQKNVAKGWNCF